MAEFIDPKLEDRMSWLKNISVLGEEPDYMELPVTWHGKVMVTFAVVEGKFNVKEWNRCRRVGRFKFDVDVGK